MKVVRAFSARYEMLLHKNLPSTFLFFLFLLGCWSCILFPVSHVGPSARLTLDLTASQQEFFQVFWAGDDEVYSPECSAVIRLRPGSSTYTIKLPALHSIEKLRLDPMVGTGDLILHALSLTQGERPVLYLTTAQDFQNLQAIHNVNFISLENANLQLAATGDDPQLELELQRPGWRKLILQNMFVALLLGLGPAVLFALLHSPGYRERAGSLFPSSRKVRLAWCIFSLLIGIFLVLVIPLTGTPGKSSFYVPAVAGVIGAGMYLVTFWLATRQVLQGKAMEPGRWSWFWYALPSYLIWLLYLFAFWPGSMSPDSLDQWRQVLAGVTHFKDWHPAFHTLTIWLLTRIRLSPAIVVLAQIAVLGGVAGWCLSVLQRWGVPRYILWATAIIFAGWLVNGLMVVTLWKDIAYSTALLALTVILFQLVMSRGQWLDRPGSLPVLALVLFCVAIYRHNGVVPALGTSLVLLLVFSGHRKKVFIACISAFLLFIAVRGPLYSLLDVRRGNPLSRVYSTTMQEVVSLLPAKQKNRLAESEVKQDDNSHESAVLSVKQEKKQYNPVQERLLASSRLWRIQTLEGFHRRIEYVNLWSKYRDNKRHIKYVSSNRTGNDEGSLLPQVMERIYVVFEKSKGGFWFFIWRPAVYLYVFLGCVAVAGYRLKSWMPLLLAFPVLLNSMPTLLIVIHKSIFRYHYGIVLVSLLFSLPLLFLNRRESS